LQQHHLIGAYLPDGTPLAFQADKNMFEVWNAKTDELIHRWEIKFDYVSDPTLSQDGRLLAIGAVGDSNDQIQLWDMVTGERLQVMEWISIPVDTLAFNPDGTLLASGAYAVSPLLWDVSTGTRLHDLFDIGIDNHVWDIEFSPDGTLLAVTTHGSVALINVKNLPHELPTYINENVAVSEVFSISFSPDGNLLATIVSFHGAAWSYLVEVWDVSTRTLLKEWDFEKPLHEVAFSPDGCLLAATDQESGSLKLWRVE